MPNSILFLGVVVTGMVYTKFRVYACVKIQAAYAQIKYVVIS